MSRVSCRQDWKLNNFFRQKERKSVAYHELNYLASQGFYFKACIMKRDAQGYYYDS